MSVRHCSDVTESEHFRTAVDVVHGGWAVHQWSGSMRGGGYVLAVVVGPLCALMVQASPWISSRYSRAALRSFHTESITARCRTYGAGFHVKVSTSAAILYTVVPPHCGATRRRIRCEAPFTLELNFEIYIK